MEAPHSVEKMQLAIVIIFFNASLLYTFSHYSFVITVLIWVAINLMLFGTYKYFKYLYIMNMRSKKQLEESKISELEQSKISDSIVIGILSKIQKNYILIEGLIKESEKEIIRKLNYKISQKQIRTNYQSEDYDPLKAAEKLQNILKDSRTFDENKWDSFYEEAQYNIENPKIQFDQRIKKLKRYDHSYSLKLEDFINELENKKSVDIVKQKLNECNKNIKILYQERDQNINNHINELKKIYEEKEKNWAKDCDTFKKRVREKNAKIDTLKLQFSDNNEKAVELYFSEILKSTSYDQNFKIDYNIEFNKKSKLLIIEYSLPSQAHFPNIKERKYIKTRNEYKDIFFSKKELDTFYEDVIYRIVLDLINICFRYDFSGLIETIAFNGWSMDIDKSTGLENKACILSIVCEKIDFLKLNLSEVEPKTCFKSLKGISANTLSQSIAVKPIIKLEKSDKRFVSSQKVSIDSKTNLASMNWEDFEHLIRELFQKEFSANGGEVRVTQSSRDGGVDAIAFDPDPIRGGKIVIQAKRYTNIVGVSAVRDLYGTVMNEGATKGILVTTSDYGTESFKFSKDKPITLINGGNLLYLLQKHGYNAMIDIKKARNKLK